MTRHSTRITLGVTPRLGNGAILRSFPINTRLPWFQLPLRGQGTTRNSCHKNRNDAVSKQVLDIEQAGRSEGKKCKTSLIVARWNPCAARSPLFVRSRTGDSSLKPKCGTTGHCKRSLHIHPNTTARRRQVFRIERCPRRAVAMEAGRSRAFSSEVDTGSRQEFVVGRKEPRSSRCADVRPCLRFPEALQGAGLA